MSAPESAVEEYPNKTPTLLRELSWCIDSSLLRSPYGCAVLHKTKHKVHTQVNDSRRFQTCVGRLFAVLVQMLSSPNTLCTTVLTYNSLPNNYITKVKNALRRKGKDNLVRVQHKSLPLGDKEVKENSKSYATLVQ